MMFLRAALRWLCFIALAFSILGPGAGCAPPRGVYHTVKPGQTLYQIGQTYQIDVDDLARVNGINDPTRLRAGSRLLIPGAVKKRVVPVTALKKTQRETAEAPQPRPVSPAVKTAGSEQRAPSPKTGPAQATKDPPRFIWPLKGDVVKKFSKQGTRPSKGIEIAVAEGTAVSAVAPGQVIYSGDGIPSFGNLIILKHDGNYFSVYGYNRKNLVKTGSFVGQGDRIALSGVPPSRGRPRLYFEIRVGKEARDPIFFLP